MNTLKCARWLLLLWGTTAGAQVPLVYSRCPRINTPVTLSGAVTKGGVTTTVSVTVPNADMVEALPDTSKQLSGFVAPCDLIFRAANGDERTLFDCASRTDGGCAALDSAVSFDAKTIAFSVFRGPLVPYWVALSPKDLDPAAENTEATYPLLPTMRLGSTEAQLYLVDVATGRLTALPHQPGVFDFGPVWLANGRLGFTTDRTKTFGTMPVCNNVNPKAIQFASIGLDGKDIARPNAHALSSELHPIALADGRVLISSWQQFGMLAYGHGNAVGDCGTLNNKFHLYGLDPDGSRQTAVYGQHLDDPTTPEYIAGLPTHMAAHFMTQSSDRRIWVDEYYRDNNLGLGIINGFELPPDGQEGMPVEEAERLGISAYRAPQEVPLASFASNADQASLPMPMPPYVSPRYADSLFYAGKVGHPAATPGNRLLVTWGKGMCTQAIGASFVTMAKALAATTHDNPACDTGIYLTPPLGKKSTGALLSHPSELQLVVDKREYHEFFARAVVPYAEIYGIEAPAILHDAATTGRDRPELTAATPFGMLGSSSILHRETKPHGGSFIFEGANQMSHVGTDTIDYRDDELCGIRILAVLPNREKEYLHLSNSPVGERVGIIGEFPVRKAVGVVDALGQPDTSFTVRLPADVPYLMQGIDCEGRTLNTDQTWQHLKSGEFRTCNGCHVHSAAADELPFSATAAGRQLSATHRLGEGVVPLLAGGAGADTRVESVAGWLYQVEFERDVMPIFAARCVSCHGASRAEAGLRLDIARTDKMHLRETPDVSTWRRVAADFKQTFVPQALKHSARQGDLGKPNLSKYVRMLNARGSLLYWKAANRRTDGRTDSDRPSSLDSGVANLGQYDVDFGADHPTSTTPQELRILARWVDLGAGWGPAYGEDTIAPTVNFVATRDAGVITGLVIGTTDVGSGLVPTSLKVCLVRDAGCLSLPSPSAAMAGTVTVDLAQGLNEPADEIEVSVVDAAGNTTAVRRSIRYLLGQAPPVLASPDAGYSREDDAGVVVAENPTVEPGSSVRGICGCASTDSAGYWLALVLLRLILRRRHSVSGRSATS